MKSTKMSKNKGYQKGYEDGYREGVQTGQMLREEVFGRPLDNPLGEPLSIWQKVFMNQLLLADMIAYLSKIKSFDFGRVVDALRKAFKEIEKWDED